MTIKEVLREKIIDIILKVAMAHHDDISASDEIRAENSADDIIDLLPQLLSLRLFYNAPRRDSRGLRRAG